MASVDEISVLTEHFDRYRRVTLQTLDFFPEERLAWRPAEKHRTIGETFLHIAQTEDYYAHGLFDRDWSFDRTKKAPATVTRDTIRETLAAIRATTLAKLGAADVRTFDRVPAVPNVPVDWPVRGWLWYLLEHELHHKGQLALALRQIGITPPFFALAFPNGVRPDGGQ